MKPNTMLYKNLSIKSFFLLFTFLIFSSEGIFSQIRKTENFDKNWKFHLGDVQKGYESKLDDSGWRILNLPHDWSIEGKFSEDNPATPGGGALPGGIGWYRKSFSVPESDKNNLIFIDFDGIYRNGEVWINDHYLGIRPYGYSSFRYELTPYLKYGKERNIISVKVDNSKQPNSRWYSGSGIYRNVWLVTAGKILVDHWGTFITTPKVSDEDADVSVQTNVKNASAQDQSVLLRTDLFDKDGNKVASGESEIQIPAGSYKEITQELEINNPLLWSVENPSLYKAVSIIEQDGKVVDKYETSFGIRTFYFDQTTGFYLNGKHLKIKGVCDHHDLGCLGAAVNYRALERQLQILKEMGCNGIRTSHNPPAPELLDLSDKLGFIVMDEAFDMWKRKKTEFDYALDWDKWHKKDLEDMVLRDRNHPSVFIWSIGNEIWEQGDSAGMGMTHELVSIIKNLDTTRPVTSNLNEPKPDNYLYKSGALDLIGFSYHQNDYKTFQTNFPGQKLIGSETTSALETRGHYDMPSDSIRVWPTRWDIPFTSGNPDYTCSAYDNCRVPWGNTHEEVLKTVMKDDLVSGMFVWTGFDYLGEPTPYPWPARSSYFGIVDLAGFPKDAYYLYQSVWTNKPVLHIFPDWNLPVWQGGWKAGDTVDVWAYTNCEEVELFLNGNSLGTKKKSGDDLHLLWRVPFTPGTLKAVGRDNGKETLVNEIKTAGEPAIISLEADRKTISADGTDLSFVTVKILDKDGNVVPYADNLVNFDISGEGKIIGVDNGSQTSHEPFKANFRKAFNGMCLVVIQSNEKPGDIVLTAKSENLKGTVIKIMSK